MSEQKHRETNMRDFCEASFHGEIWMRCRLCDRCYEAHSEFIDKETGEKYCPWCYGYGKRGADLREEGNNG